MAHCLRCLLATLVLNMACAPGGVAPVEYPVSRVYQADTGSVSAAVTSLAQSLDLGMLPDDPWKQTTTLRLQWHWGDEHKAIHWPKDLDYARYMRCPDDHPGKTLNLLHNGLTARQRAFDLRVQMRPVAADSVAVHLGAAAWEEPENTEDEDWEKCESTGLLETTLLTGIDSLLTAGPSQ